VQRRGEVNSRRVGNGGIPGHQRADRRAESEFAQGVLADAEDSNSRYLMRPESARRSSEAVVSSPKVSASTY
jgi:hypothetical protein